MKYLKVSVKREAKTDLYIEVPDEFDPKEIMRAAHRPELGTIAADTTDYSDWDDRDWETTVEALSVSVVTDDEANEFQVGKLKGV